jgi:hypothetical protein
MVSKGVLVQRYSILGLLSYILRLLERIGVIIGWFAAYASGLGVLLLVSSGNLSIWSLYEFQPSDFCTLELGIVQSLHGFYSQVERI